MSNLKMSLVGEVRKIFKERSTQENLLLMDAMLEGMNDKVRNAEERADKIESMAMSLFFIACADNPSRESCDKEWQNVFNIIDETEGKTDKNWKSLIEWKVRQFERRK